MVVIEWNSGDNALIESSSLVFVWMINGRISRGFWAFVETLFKKS